MPDGSLAKGYILSGNLSFVVLFVFRMEYFLSESKVNRLLSEFSSWSGILNVSGVGYPPSYFCTHSIKSLGNLILKYCSNYFIWPSVTLFSLTLIHVMWFMTKYLPIYRYLYPKFYIHLYDQYHDESNNLQFASFQCLDDDAMYNALEFFYFK